MKTNSSREAGSTLLVALIIMLIVATAIAISVDTTMQTARLAQRSQRFEGAQAVGDAYLDWAFGQWRTTCAASSNVPLASSSFNPLTAPSASFLPSPANSVVTGYQILGMSPAGVLDASTSTTTAPAKASFQNSGDSSWFYLASATVTAPTITNKKITTTVNRVFEKHLSSPWEYAIFYNDTLEFHPSPSFTVNGMVKSNGAIYASPDAGAPLNFGNAVYYATSFSDGYAPGDFTWRDKSWAAAGLPASAAGSGDPSDPDNFTAGLPPSEQNRADPFGISPASFSTTSTNPNSNAGYHELLQPAVAGYTDPFNSNGVDSRFYDNASVKVLIDVNNNVTIMNQSNVVQTSTSAMYKAVMPAITTDQNIQDTREAATVRLATVDVGLLKTTTIPGWNGVLYISDTSAGPTGAAPKRGIRVSNGATIPTGGLTVVANNPLYVQGDYNTSTTRQPSALVADAINVLSNSWVDANSTLALTSRNASNTTVNAAFMSGIDPTVSTYGTNMDYSGGVENFPRFLENWTNMTFTYNGSMVELFTSMQAIGRWATASYNPPTRNWAFDTSFLTTPPPGTLYTISYIKGRWYIQ